MSILTERARERMSAHTMKEQLEAIRRELETDLTINILEKRLIERRIKNVDVAIERRGVNPQRKGWEDNDTETDSV